MIHKMGVQFNIRVDIVDDGLTMSSDLGDGHTLYRLTSLDKSCI